MRKLRKLDSKITFFLLAFLVCLIAIPPFVSGYWKDAFVLFAINIILIMSYRLVTTMGGWSFAHIVQMGFGGYISALLTTRLFNFSFWLALPLSGLASAIFALIISYPVLRTRGFYFFLSTFAAGEALRQCFIRFQWLFGGIEGISFIERPRTILGIDFTKQMNFYYLVVAIAILSGVALYRFSRCRIGLSISAVRSNERLSEAVGINSWAYKSSAFIVGSFFAGIAGSLFAHYNGFVAPTDYTSTYMYKIIAASIIGGTTTFAGPIIGLLLLTAAQEFLRELLDWLPLVYGAIIICILLFLPNGIETVFSSSEKMLSKRKRGSREAGKL